MKTLSALKTLPLIGLLATGLALAPMVSIADDDDRGRGKDRVYKKYDGGKGHYRDGHRSHRRDHGHYKRGHSHSKDHKHGIVTQAYSKHRKHGHKHHGYAHHTHGHKHYGHSHHGHRHVDTVVVHDHRDYDPFRLLLGLHFDNIDIIYRDY